MRDLIGRTLGHYRIVEKIGEGGMGEVYRAHDERLDRDVAIKVIHEQVAQNAERLARFEREAKAVAKLAHPNILAIHDFGTEGGVTYAVTELLNGQNLRQAIPASGMSWQKVVEIGAAIADGLAAAHGRGIVHRDLKPENVFITSDGRVKVLDFGLARVKEPVEEDAETATLTPAGTVPGSVLGTMGYMSPEQLRGEPTDARSDIFALGCVLYEMLSGKAAFVRKSAAETSAAILGEEPERVSSTGILLPAEVERSIHRCLEKSPEARFQSASDLAYNIKSISTDQVVSVPSARRKPRTTRLMIAAAFVLVLVALTVLLGPGLLDRSGPEGETQSIHSIAILPLQNLTGDPEQAYFVDGLHEELIATFAQISAFDKVTARTSVMGFRDSDTPIREIGEQLGVEAVLEGSVRRSGETVRVTLQLIDAGTESHLWADSFERDLKDILALQSEVARTVAGEVRVALTPLEEIRLAKPQTVNRLAYESYRRGVQRLRKGRSATYDDLATAVELFESAVAQDPSYAPSYVGLSRAYCRIAVNYRPAVEVMPKAHASAVKALELGETSPEAHAQLGNILASWTWDWSGAETEFRRAFELSPNDVDVVRDFAQYLGCVGRSQEAIELQKRAVELNPLDPTALINLGWTYWAARQYDDAIEQLLATVLLYPDVYWPHLILSWSYTLKGLHDEALAEIERAEEIHNAANEDPFFLMSQVWPYALAGRTAEANEALQRLLALREQTYVPPSYVAFGYIYIGDFDRAIEWMERAFEARAAQIQCLALPAYDSLRDDPRFQDIVRRMNFPEIRQ